MAGLTCPMCSQAAINPEVRLIFKNQTVHKTESALKCMDYALENHFTPCVIQYVYVCQKCGYEDIKHERFYNERI